jgi:hypothetical protein
MKNIPTLHNKTLESIFENITLTNEQLNEILACEKASLTDDLHAIINFCDKDLDDKDDNISYNLLFYALFLLKEIQNENQLNLILDILKWDEDKIEYWFEDLFLEYYWNLVYHFGQKQIETLVDFLKLDGLYSFSKEQVALALFQIYLKHPEKQETISNYWTELLEFYNAIAEDSENIDYNYFAFFVSYIFEPNDDQKRLIKGLYDKDYIDLFVNGDYEALLEFTENERECSTVFDLNSNLIKIENQYNTNYNAKIFEEFSRLGNNQKPIVLEKKINRNDPCLCGSGKKYKKCCLN